MKFSLKDERGPREKVVTNLITAILLFGLVYWGWTKTTPPSKASAPVEIAEIDLSANAYIMCKRHIKNNLVAPATADFPFLDFTSVKTGDQKYHVRSFVDSQNGFGATIRTSCSCDIEHDSVGDQHNQTSWTLLDLEAD